jgi:hypothetical protein
MGLVRWGPPQELITQLRDAFAVNTFVETGTYRADTAMWAAKLFDNVVTVEGSEKVFKFAANRLRNLPNIKALHGDTRALLPGILQALTRPAIFWLDAHWTGGPTYAHEGEECPLLGELKLVTRSPLHHFLLIDDARLFLAPPPHPFQASHWPSIEQVFAAIHDGPHPYHIVVFEDVIIALPPAAKELVTRYCQERGK